MASPTCDPRTDSPQPTGTFHTRPQLHLTGDDSDGDPIAFSLHPKAKEASSRGRQLLRSIRLASLDEPERTPAAACGRRMLASDQRRDSSPGGGDSDTEGHDSDMEAGDRLESWAAVHVQAGHAPVATVLLAPSGPQ